MAVPLNLVAKRADHLRMASVTAFANIDIPARQFERRVGSYPIDFLDSALQIVKRSDFDETADRDHDQNTEDQ